MRVFNCPGRGAVIPGKTEIPEDVKILDMNRHFPHAVRGVVEMQKVAALNVSERCFLWVCQVPGRAP